MEIKKKEKVYNGYFKIFEVTVQQDGDTFTREQFERGNAVAAVVFNTDTEQFILTSQYRIGAESELIEVVAGMIDKGEEPAQSIAREIKEEIGYHADKVEHLYTFYSSPGACTEKVELYYVEVSHQEHEGGGNAHENEKIELVKLSKEEFLQLKSPDAKTIIAQQWIMLKQHG